MEIDATKLPEGYVPADFKPQDHMMVLKGRDYLTVQSRLVWFLQDQRQLIAAGLARAPFFVKTTQIAHDPTARWAEYSTTVRDVLGNEATMNGSESAKDFGDYLEKASTKSLGRALLALGYGTANAQELDEGERVVDAPVERRPGRSSGQAVERPAPEPDDDDPRGGGGAPRPVATRTPPPPPRPAGARPAPPPPAPRRAPANTQDPRKTPLGSNKALFAQLQQLAQEEPGFFTWAVAVYFAEVPEPFLVNATVLQGQDFLERQDELFEAWSAAMAEVDAQDLLRPEDPTSPTSTAFEQLKARTDELVAAGPTHKKAVIDILTHVHPWANTPGQKMRDTWTAADVTRALTLLVDYDPGKPAEVNLMTLLTERQAKAS